MKKHLFVLIILILSIAACTAAPAPMVTVLETPADSSLPEPSPSLPEGYLPDVKCTGSYTANSGTNLYEDEEYIIFRNGNGIIVFDKNRNSIADILPRSNAFTYCDKKVYYIGYDADTRKRNITEYNVTSGSKKEIYQMDNTAVSMLEYNGRLYYAYPTDPKSITASELRSVALDGSDMRKIKAQGIENFVIKGDYVYYTETYTNKDSTPYLYKLSLKDGGTEKISELSKPYRFEMSGDTLLYPSGDFYIESYDIQTGKTFLTPDIAYWKDWGCDFTILGQYIILTSMGDHAGNEPSLVSAYDLDSGKLNDLTELDSDDFDLYATVNGVYIAPNKLDGTSQLYKVTISGGKASLKEIINYSPDIQPSSDTFIIASSYGGIYGGYSDGKWLTHSEAAAYCKGKMTFGEYNLARLKGTIKSTGVTCDAEGGGDCIASHTYCMAPDTWDENSYFILNIPERSNTGYNYSNDPLCFSNLYYGGKFPDIEILSDASELSGAVQSLIDKKIGSGNAEAKIRLAVNADIDGDGEKETVVNADNCAEEYFNSEGDDKDAAKKHWYCLSCIIESDGTVKVIDHYYFVPTPDKPAEYEESYTYYEDAQFMYVQNILDIDGDGLSELILDWSGWEAGETTVYKYDGNNVGEIMSFDSWE